MGRPGTILRNGVNHSSDRDSVTRITGDQTILNFAIGQVHASFSQLFSQTLSRVNCKNWHNLRHCALAGALVCSLPFDGVEGSSFGQHQDGLGAKDVAGGKERDCALLLSSER